MAKKGKKSKATIGAVEIEECEWDDLEENGITCPHCGTLLYDVNELIYPGDACPHVLYCFGDSQGGEMLYECKQLMSWHLTSLGLGSPDDPGNRHWDDWARHPPNPKLLAALIGCNLTIFTIDEAMGTISIPVADRDISKVKTSL